MHTYIYTYIHTYIHTHTRAHTHTHICIHTYIHVCRINNTKVSSIADMLSAKSFLVSKGITIMLLKKESLEVLPILFWLKNFIIMFVLFVCCHPLQLNVSFPSKE